MSALVAKIQSKDVKAGWGHLDEGPRAHSSAKALQLALRLLADPAADPAVLAGRAFLCWEWPRRSLSLAYV